LGNVRHLKAAATILKRGLDIFLQEDERERERERERESRYSSGFSN